MFCPKCKGEYREGFTSCAECGVDLVQELNQAEEDEPRYRDMVAVASFADRVSAGSATSLLKNEGIAAWVRADDGGGVRPELTFTRGARVYVPQAQAARAKELLAALEVTE